MFISSEKCISAEYCMRFLNLSLRYLQQKLDKCSFDYFHSICEQMLNIIQTISQNNCVLFRCENNQIYIHNKNIHAK